MRILIAEDSAVVRAGLAEILADSGHQVAAAMGNAGDLLAAVASTARTPPWWTYGCRPARRGNATCWR